MKVQNIFFLGRLGERLRERAVAGPKHPCAVGRGRCATVHVHTSPSMSEEEIATQIDVVRMHRRGMSEARSRNVEHLEAYHHAQQAGIAQEGGCTRFSNQYCKG